MTLGHDNDNDNDDSSRDAPLAVVAIVRALRNVHYASGTAATRRRPILIASNIDPSPLEATAVNAGLAMDPTRTR